MAQIDTGMGWNAKDTYLIYSAAEIGQLTEAPHWDLPGYTLQEVPVAQPIAIDVVNNGLDMATWTFNRATYHEYVAANKPGVLVAKFYSGVNSSPAKTIYYLPDSSYQVYYQETENAYYYPLAVWTNPDSTQVSGDTVYYYYQQLTGWRWDAGSLTINVPVFPYNSSLTGCVADGYPHIVPGSSTPIYKDIDGYAAACSAIWLTQNNVKITTPILISSESGYTDMTCATSGYNIAKLNILYKGIRFYMAFFDIVEKSITSQLPLVDLTGLGTLRLEQVFKLIAQETYANIQVTDAPDPYEEQTDPSGEDGGEGEDPEDDPVDEETLPLPAVVGLGFSTIYVPTQTDLYNLAAYLWGGNLDLDNFLKLFANPMDSILGLSAVPVVLSGTPEPIYLGGQQLQGITMPRYTGRTAIKVDMGTVTIKERWGAYLDYDPYTELSIYVPFIGIKNIKADDVMGKTIRLMYNIDILSGACVAYLRIEGGSVMYEWAGQCAEQIPITGANWDNIFSTAIGTAATLGGALFAPASAPVLSGAVASAAVQAVAAKPRIERSGAMNGITGFLGQLRPYVIRTIPEAYIPNDQNKFIGYPSYVSVNLGELSGYNEVASIHLENIPATGDELSELESILKGGAIF